jgi:DNA-binding response OmpR family regulator
MAKTILIADDEPNIVRSLEFLLGNAGYAVQVARNGDEALKSLETFAPDAVLLDVMMPGKSGYAVCRKMRENKAWCDIKIIMLTAKGRDTEVDKGIAMGADAYITKPFSTTELLAKLRELLDDNVRHADS